MFVIEHHPKLDRRTQIDCPCQQSCRCKSKRRNLGLSSSKVRNNQRTIARISSQVVQSGPTRRFSSSHSDTAVMAMQDQHKSWCDRLSEAFKEYRQPKPENNRVETTKWSVRDSRTAGQAHLQTGSTSTVKKLPASTQPLTMSSSADTRLPSPPTTTTRPKQPPHSDAPNRRSCFNQDSSYATLRS